ncbi:MAG: CDF family Co(II)/Ni(II) efflux transporter DmeF [Polyangiales bacterium]
MNATTSRPCQHVDDAKLEATRAERRTRWVVGITAVMMVAELVVGTLAKSLALVADGWHMATHAGALGLAALAYWYARTRAREATFTFGTGKVHALTGFTNAVVLLLVAVAMLTEGVTRLVHPEKVNFDEALPVAIIGLIVNIVCFFLLHPGGAHDHSHDHGHDHDHGPENHDHDVNLKAAYMHVAADALTSVLAIAALFFGRTFGWVFLDPATAILGSVVILRWGVGLVAQSGRQLLDVTPSPEVEVKIREAIEALGEGEVRDLHVWEMGQGRRGCIVSVLTSVPRPLEEYRAAVLAIASIDHLTVEIDHLVAESRASF